MKAAPKRRGKKKKRRKAISRSKKDVNQNEIGSASEEGTSGCEEDEHPKFPIVKAKFKKAIPRSKKEVKPTKCENTANMSYSKDTEKTETTSEKNEVESPNIHTIQPNKKLLILDINGVLADVVDRKPKGCNESLSLNRKHVIRRPFCAEFLNFCFQEFHVAVWSSRTIWTLESLLPFLFQNLHHNLLFCWSRSECTKTGYTTVEEKSKPLVLKELRKVWDYDEDDGFDETNTLLIDDSPYKALRNPPYTAIFPYPYSCQNHDDFALGKGGEIRVYLEGIAEAETVPDYVANNPFGQKPISESSASWEFYKMIIG